MLTDLTDSMRSNDALWLELVNEAEIEIAGEPTLSDFIGKIIMESDHLGSALSKILCTKLNSEIFHKEFLNDLYTEYWSTSFDERIELPKRDLLAIRDRDPACRSYLVALLHLKGFQALQAQRLTHWLWNNQREHLAIALQCRISERFGVDIHPAAKIGSGLVIDHATNVVIGETAVLGDDITMLQGVTLGGTGKEGGDRHPKVRNGAHIWAGAKVLGNIVLGEHCQVGACSVVLDDVPAHSTVVGVPARVISSNSEHFKDVAH